MKSFLEREEGEILGKKGIMLGAFGCSVCVCLSNPGPVGSSYDKTHLEYKSSSAEAK